MTECLRERQNVSEKVQVNLSLELVLACEGTRLKALVHVISVVLRYDFLSINFLFLIFLLYCAVINCVIVFIVPASIIIFS